MAEATVDEQLAAIKTQLSEFNTQIAEKEAEINSKIDLLAKRIAKATEAEMQLRLLARGIEKYTSWNQVRDGLYRNTEINIAILEALKGKKD